MAEGGSGGSSFRSEEAELRALIVDVQGMQSTLQTRISKLNAAVDTIEGAWKGSAHGAYDQLQRQANEYARKLQNHLRFIEEALEASKGGFSKNEMEELDKYKMIAGQSPISDFTSASPAVK
ncbi:WXG100 family type VII secretion target [Streptomyces sp. NPDC054784]